MIPLDEGLRMLTAGRTTHFNPYKRETFQMWHMLHVIRSPVSNIGAGIREIAITDISR